MKFGAAGFVQESGSAPLWQETEAGFTGASGLDSYDTEDKPVRPWITDNEPKPWGYQDEEYYCLDTSHPEAMAYMKMYLKHFTAGGAEMFKTDFMLWGLQDSSRVKEHAGENLCGILPEGISAGDQRSHWRRKAIGWAVLPPSCHRLWVIRMACA